jgi:hypothetical protein
MIRSRRATQGSPAPSWHRWALTLGLIAAFSGVRAEPLPPPSTRLFGATVSQARQVVTESAIGRGWAVGELHQDAVVLERITETDGTGEHAVALIRIEALLRGEGGDAVVSLRAVQVDAPETPAERAREITDRYRDNLARALDALRDRWELSLTVEEPQAEHAEHDPPRASGQPSLGTWAYYAERYARESGCQLADTGAVLVSSDADTELHRVDCRGGAPIWVRCHLGHCAAADQ